MRLRFVGSLLINSFLAFSTTYALPNDSLKTVPRSIDLNEVVIKANGLQEARKKARVMDVSLRFGVLKLGDERAWDSTYFLTGFTSPGSKKFSLVSVEGRIADFDTSNFEMFLTVLQLNGTDTLFREIPIKLEAGKRSRQRHVMDLRDYGIVLQPTTFYLGYGFHTKLFSEDFSYRLYASVKGGEGAILKINDGKWRLSSRSGMPYIFPFKMTYIER